MFANLITVSKIDSARISDCSTRGERSLEPDTQNFNLKSSLSVDVVRSSYLRTANRGKIKVPNGQCSVDRSSRLAAISLGEAHPLERQRPVIDRPAVADSNCGAVRMTQSQERRWCHARAHTCTRVIISYVLNLITCHHEFVLETAAQRFILLLEFFHPLLCTSFFINCRTN